MFPVPAAFLKPDIAFPVEATVPITESALGCFTAPVPEVSNDALSYFPLEDLTLQEAYSVAQVCVPVPAAFLKPDIAFPVEATVPITESALGCFTVPVSEVSNYVFSYFPLKESTLQEAYSVAQACYQYQPLS